ncbi:hypothetical protein D3218_10710 [Aureimonas flava]|uniref:Uncharacterized protein n=1 Tax=Aureimonas flava TaxID=2320271 RepID=A0A3A1WMB1_9HYPH|nr:hypothetical protein [Aureimonas flava]RIY00867.1 hypothetical protein D3218_10710 [Aureimonas flava]
MPERRPSPLAPRLVNREVAAAYAGIGATKFDELVRSGVMPKAKRVGTRRLWDVHRLDAAIDDLPDEAARVVNEWDDLPEAPRAR